MTQARILSFTFFGFLLFSPLISFAQTPCGNIIAPTDINVPTVNIVSTPITDCTDPFFRTVDIASPYTLHVADTIIHDGDTVAVPQEATDNYRISGFPLLTSVNHSLYLHDGNDYRFTDTRVSEPQEADYRELAIAFFPAGTDIEPFVAAILDWNLAYDMDEVTQNLFWEYTDYVDQNFVSKPPLLHAGTYTLVSKEYQLYVTQKSFLEKLFASIIPTAYAQWYPENIFTLTFTITEEPSAPTGISNILFLPGIQASRLYVDENGNERKLWEPTGDSDVELLRMTDTGESINDVYTKDVVDELPDGSDIYKGFLQYLKDMDGPFNGPVIETFPYDWRRDVFDIVQNGTEMKDGTFKTPVSSVKFLADTSRTGKVTLIAHSNGGLLAKAIMLKLQEEGKANLVDKVIFIATPHLGTPKGIAALLHGYDQEHIKGLISTDEKVRSVMKNMPGVYGLLPSEVYISTLTEPMISFDGFDTTKAFNDAYGFTITNMDEYTRFLNGIEERVDAGNNINELSTANSSMLASALLEHKENLDNWTAPSGVSVFNIVGEGLPTPKAIEYRGFDGVNCYMGYGCVHEKEIEPVLHFTNYGDGTVVSKSATTITSGDKYYFNLYLANRGIRNLDNDHADITETPEVQTLVDHILHSSSTDAIPFISTTEPTFSTNSDIFTIHSPARIYLRDTNGKVTGRTEVGGEWKTEIQGSDYFEAGGVKYVIVPSDISYTVTIEGEGNGVYTHEIKTLQGDIEVPQHSFTASVTPMMIATYQKTGNAFSTITVDVNGDGKVDTVMTQDGKIIEEEKDDEKDNKTCENLEVAIHNLHLSSKYKNELLELKHKEDHSCKDKKDKKDKEHSNIKEQKNFEQILERISQHKKAMRITEIERQKIREIINRLIK